MYRRDEQAFRYWRFNNEGKWSLVYSQGQLAYVASDGIWTLNGRTLMFPDGQYVELPESSDAYGFGTGVGHYNGAVVMDKFNSFLISGKDLQCGIYENASVDGSYSLSGDFRYAVSMADSEFAGRPELAVWIRNEGVHMIPDDHRYVNAKKHSLMVGVQYLVFNNGSMLFLGASDQQTESPWQIWRVDLQSGEFSRFLLKD